MKRTSTWLTASLLFAVALVATPLRGQGLLVVDEPGKVVPLPRPIIHPRPRPLPPASYRIKELAVQARIMDQIAQVQVTQSFVNTGSRQMEVSFVFPLPYDGAIDRLTFMIDGQEHDARLLPASEARSIYEGYIRRNRDPALLEWIGTGMFKTSVFPLPPGAERKVTLRFSQLLRKDHQLTDFLFPMSTAKYTSQPVEKVTFEASIQSTAEIKSVYSPTHPLEIKRPGKLQAVVKYEGTNLVPTSDLRLFFDTAAGELGTSVISYRPSPGEDGYFLMLASPAVKAPSAARLKKTVILVVDRSGSMAGKKIEQAKEALKFVVNNLRDGDLFNIVAYDSSVESFQPELQRYDDETRTAALGFVEGIYAGGSTNIDGALTTALAMIQDDSRPNFMVFMTDGRPTAGETNESKIVANAQKNNAIRARLVNFGVGYDVNSRLLDRLSHGNYGQSEYVRPNEDIEAQVSRLYSKISSPVMTNVVVGFEFDEAPVEEGKNANRTYPREVHDLFQGEQLVVVGRYKRHGTAKVTIAGDTVGNAQKFQFPAHFVESSGDETYAFIEKLWAMRRIGEIIDELDLHGNNEELIKELVALSTQHGILTPYTSFLADENAPVSDLADADLGRDRARRLLSRLKEVEGQAAFAQRANKKFLKKADQIAAPARPATASKPAPAGAEEPADEKAKSVGGGLGGVRLLDIDKDREINVESVHVVGNETLYKRGKQWIAANAAEIDLTKDADKIETVERFSDEYFQLIKKNTPSENAVLARQQEGEELIIKLRGQVYLFK